MTRTTNWQRNNYFADSPVAGGPLVFPMATFSEGETLIRTRVDLQIVGNSNPLSTRFTSDWQSVQVEVAMCWDQGAGGGTEPPGYFDSVFFPWVWAQQVSFQLDSLIIEPYTPYLNASTYTNTAESRSIDCHSERLTGAGNTSTLWFVLDVQVVQPEWNTYFQLDSFSAGWSVMSMLPA